MVSALTNLWISFLAGLFAPLVAVCVLPLYPGFLSYLASQLSGKEEKKTFIFIGLIVTLGVLVSMFLFGLIFTLLLQESLTMAIGIISPIAFGILALISLLLIFNIDFGKLFPKVHAPVTKNPILTSFIFGLFFGAIVLPCNPASLAVLFAVSTSVTSFILNLSNFTVFGIGMAAPLLIFSFISAAKSTEIIGFLTKYKKKINFIAGIIMLGISLYYLIFVFRIFG
ncbi:cytochrome C biogenesis protein [Candidatus Woesearchaeota archaeon]|nr:cytochrome C biogenesis protein [Candidatus Woesearchaeota archaeon]